MYLNMEYLVKLGISLCHNVSKHVLFLVLPLLLLHALLHLHLHPPQQEDDLLHED